MGAEKMAVKESQDRCQGQPTVGPVFLLKVMTRALHDQQANGPTGLLKFLREEPRLFYRNYAVIRSVDQKHGRGLLEIFAHRAGHGVMFRNS